MDGFQGRDRPPDLLARARHRDLKAVRALFGRHISSVYDYAFRLTGSSERAEPTTTVAFQTAVAALHAGAPPAAVREALYAAATRAALAAEPAPAVASIDVARPAAPEDSFLAARLTAPAVIKRDRDFAQLVSSVALNEGPAAYAAFDLRYRRGFRAKVVARILGMAPEEVRTACRQVGAAVDRAAQRYVVGRHGTAHCSALRWLLLDFADTPWTSSRRTRLEEHLVTCPRCAVRPACPDDARRLIAALVRARPSPAFRARLLLDLSLAFFTSRAIAKERPRAADPEPVITPAAPPTSRRHASRALWAVPVAVALLAMLVFNILTSQPVGALANQLARISHEEPISSAGSPADGPAMAEEPSAQATPTPAAAPTEEAAAREQLWNTRAAPAPAPTTPSPAEVEDAGLAALSAAIRAALEVAAFDSGQQWLAVPASGESASGWRRLPAN